MSRSMRLLLPGFVLLLAAGCAVGPNYKRPYVPTAAAYKELNGWTASEPADILKRGPWWQMFHDPVLDDLENEVDISNQNIIAAANAAAHSRALVREAEASFWPFISVTGGATYSGGNKPTVDVKTASANLNWSIDIWGQIRRTVESQEANAQASAAALADARLAAHADLATDYFELRAQDQLQRLLGDIEAADETSLKIAQARFEAGVAYKADILSAETQVLSAKAARVNAGISRATLEHAIAVLIGKPPAELSLQAGTLSTYIPTVPPGVPSTLLERRPDIAEAERTVAAANAQIGVAISAFFPSLTLTASDAYQGFTLDKLIRTSNEVWSIGPTLALELFDGALRFAEVSAARATYREAVASYRETVLTAFEQVEDQLVTLRTLEKQAKLESALVLAARQAETLTLDQYKAGTTPYSSVITAQTTRLSAEETALSVRLNQFTSSVGLIEALGGGWNASELK